MPVDERGIYREELNDYIRRVLCEVVIPLVQQHGVSRMVLGKTHLGATDLPSGIAFTQQELAGTPVRHRRHHLGIAAQWPDGRMETLRYQIMGFVYKGEADLPVGDAILQVPAGYSLIVPASVPTGTGSTAHWFRPNPQNASSDILWIHIYPFGVEIFTCHTRGSLHHSGWGNRFIITNPQMFPLFEACVAEMDSELSLAPTVAASYLLILLSLVQRECDSANSTADGEPFSDRIGREMDDPVVIAGRAMHYIDANLKEKLSLDTIAAATYVSRSHLSQVFRKETGQTVWEYVTQQRLKKAKTLLTDTDLSMSEVNRRSGLCRSSHFFTRFAELTGLSPGDYRRKARGEKREVQNAKATVKRAKSKARKRNVN